MKLIPETRREHYIWYLCFYLNESIFIFFFYFSISVYILRYIEKRINWNNDSKMDNRETQATMDMQASW
jgi:hypothetical protein